MQGMFNAPAPQMQAMPPQVQQAAAMQAQAQQMNAANYFKYCINHYLSTEEGKDLVKNHLKDFPDLQKFIEAHVNLHEKAKQLALDDNAQSMMSKMPARQDTGHKMIIPSVPLNNSTPQQAGNGGLFG